MEKKTDNKMYLSVRIDRQDKEKAAELFNSIGLTISQAITLFIKQSLNQKKIPFDLYTPDNKDICTVEQKREA